jgi:DnaJ family protein C protein 11
MLTSLLACGHRLSTSPQTEATISLDASQVVNSNGSFLNAITQLAGADVRQLFMKASTMTTISPKTQITYSGSMLARRNAGGGNLLTTLKHQYSQKLALEVGTTALRPRLVNGKISYAFDADSFLTVESSVRSLSRLPPLNITYGRKITESATGFFKLSTGSSYSFLALLPYAESIPFLQPRAGTVSNLTAGISTSTYSVDVTTDQFLDGQVSASYGNLKIFGHQQHGWKLSTSLAVSFAGAASVNINTDKKLTESTKIGLGIGAGLGNGVLTFKMRVSRLGQRLSIPIILSTDASARLIISTVLVPGLSIASLQYFYLTPRRRDRIARKLRELREEVREQNEEKRKEALEATELLAEQVARKREIEMSKDGLVILEAKYRGAGRHLDPEEIKETELDVTVAVQALVATPQADRSEPRSTTTAESTLVIPGGRSKANIIGFYDILVGSKKQLAITYLFKGRRHYVVYDDYAAVAIPMRAHLVE